MKNTNRSKKVGVGMLIVCVLLLSQDAQAGLFGAMVGDVIAHHEAEKAQQDRQNNVLTNHPIISAMAETVAGAAVGDGITHNFVKHPVRDSLLGVGGAVAGAGYLIEKYHCHEGETYDGVHQWTCNGVEGSHPWKQEAIDLVTQNASNARKLAASLKKNGEPRPGEGCAAHHIISSDDSNDDAAGAREILDHCKILINSAINGVWLPQSRTDTECGGRYHRTLHTDEYYSYVYKMLADAMASNTNDDVACENVKEALSKIKKRLSSMPGVG
ncbi:MAG: AHH domain-containing protein [Acidithiobacillus sp.]